MNLLDVVSLSLNNMFSRKLRSWLTVLGIVIAVASIIVLISLGSGVNAQVNSRLNSLGNDIMTITPGASRATRGGGPGLEVGGGGFGGGGFGGFGGGAQSEAVLKFSDASAIRLVDGVASVDPRLSGRLKMSFKGINATVSVVGVDPNAFKLMSPANLTGGKLLSQNDRFTAVLGFRIYNSTFQSSEMLNRQVKIGNYSFQVVGLLNTTSGSSVVSDNTVYIPLDTAKTVLGESQDATEFLVKVGTGRNVDTVASAIELKMQQLHHVTANTEDFTITTASFFTSAASGITSTLTLFLGGIAAISLLVGAIGVANTMFMSVLERTKEIGILKALGMKDTEITMLFLVEAAMIGFFGGALGILLALGVSYILTTLSVPTAITSDLLVGSLLFSSIIGIASGAIPARNAAKLQPVEALRYE